MKKMLFSKIKLSMFLICITILLITSETVVCRPRDPKEAKFGKEAEDAESQLWKERWKDQSKWQMNSFYDSEPYINILRGKTREWSSIDTKPQRINQQRKRSDDPLSGGSVPNPALQNDLGGLNMSNPISKYHCPINLLYGNNLTVKNYFLLLPRANMSCNDTLQQFQSVGEESFESKALPIPQAASQATPVEGEYSSIPPQAVNQVTLVELETISSVSESSGENISTAVNISSTATISPAENITSTENAISTEFVTPAENKTLTENTTTTENITSTGNLITTESIASTGSLVSTESLASQEAVTSKGNLSTEFVTSVENATTVAEITVSVGENVTVPSESAGTSGSLPPSSTLPQNLSSSISVEVKASEETTGNLSSVSGDNVNITSLEVSSIVSTLSSATVNVTLNEEILRTLDKYCETYNLRKGTGVMLTTLPTSGNDGTADNNKANYYGLRKKKHASSSKRPRKRSKTIRNEGADLQKLKGIQKEKSNWKASDISTPEILFSQVTEKGGVDSPGQMVSQDDVNQTCEPFWMSDNLNYTFSPVNIDLNAVGKFHSFLGDEQQSQKLYGSNKLKHKREQKRRGVRKY